MSLVNFTDKYIKREILEVILYLLLGSLMIIFVFTGVGLGAKAFEDSFNQSFSIDTYLGNFLSYIPFILVGLLLPLFALGKLFLLNKEEHISELKNPRYYHFLTVGSYIFDPEDGFLWFLSEQLGFKGDKNLMRWSKSILRMVVIGIILFGLVGLLLISFPKQMTFLRASDVPQITLQQITPASEVIFGTEPAAWSETMTLVFIFCSLMGLNGYLCAKFKLGKWGFFLIGLFIVSLLVGGIWAFWHFIHYQNQEATLFSTFIFGTVGSMLTLLFGVLLFFYLWHFINNFFSMMIELGISTIREDILFIGWTLWGILLASYLFLEFYLYYKKIKIGEDTYFKNV